MYYVGVDLHKAQSWFYTMDAAGKRIDSKSIANSPCVLKEYFQALPRPFVLAVETTYNWYFFVDIAQTYAKKVYLANSYELKAFAKRNKKTDKIDARLIADILRKGYLPQVTIAGKETRKMRELLHYRINMVADRTRNISRLKAMLDKLGQNSNGDFTTYKRLSEISIGRLNHTYQEIIAGYIQRIKELNEKLYQLQLYIDKEASKDKDIMNLMSIPGIGSFSAALIKAEIIEINRFGSFNRLCSYAGLAPRVSQSAGKAFYGPLNVNRRKKLQWIMIEASFHFIKAIPEEAKRYAAIASKKGKNTAKVIMARHILKIVYRILKEKRPFYHNEPRSFKIQSAVAPALCEV